MGGPGFAVIELATTGLLAEGNDRVTEVAVVHLSAEGRHQGRWTTPVDPGIVTGRQRVRRIHSAGVEGAPSFERVADRLLELLAGRVLVAHNASFHMRFLAAEFQRIGRPLPPGTVLLCTMQLARDFRPGTPRSLGRCSSAYGVSAAAAAAAATPGERKCATTAALLAAFIDLTPDRDFWDRHLSDALDYPWPVAARDGSSTSSADAAPWRSQPRNPRPPQAQAPGFLAGLVLGLPEYDGPAEHLDYLALLDRCVSEQFLSGHEARALLRLSELANISQFACETLNRDYFHQLCAAARRGDRLSDEQVLDLWQVGNILDLPLSVIGDALEGPDATARVRLLAG